MGCPTTFVQSPPLRTVIEYHSEVGQSYLSPLRKGRSKGLVHTGCACIVNDPEFVRSLRLLTYNCPQALTCIMYNTLTSNFIRINCLLFLLLFPNFISLAPATFNLNFTDQFHEKVVSCFLNLLLIMKITIGCSCQFVLHLNTK